MFADLGRWVNDLCVASAFQKVNFPPILSSLWILCGSWDIGDAGGLGSARQIFHFPLRPSP